MKILVCLNTLEIAGVEINAIELSARLRDTHGFDITAGALLAHYCTTAAAHVRPLSVAVADGFRSSAVSARKKTDGQPADGADSKEHAWLDLGRLQVCGYGANQVLAAQRSGGAAIAAQYQHQECSA